MTHQQVAGRAQGRVGGDAGIAVRAAALQRHGEFADRHLGAAHLVGVLQRLAHEVDPGLDGLAGAADGLDVHRCGGGRRASVPPAARRSGSPRSRGRSRRWGEVDVPRVAGQGAAQQPQRLALVMPQPVLWVSATTPSTLGKSASGSAPVNGLRLNASAIRPATWALQFTAGQDADVVAGGDAAVGPADAHGSRGGRVRAGRAGVDARGVVLGEVAHAAVVHVDVLAGRDVGGGEADDLAVAPDRLAERDGPHRDLVAGGDPSAGRRRRGPLRRPAAACVRAITTPSSGCSRMTSGVACALRVQATPLLALRLRDGGFA